MTDPVPATPERVSLGPRTVARVGYGAMQLEHVATDDAVAVVRRAVELGVDHLDTASFYGDAVVNGVLRRALEPWPAHLVVASKVGAAVAPGPPGLRPAQHPDDLRAQVHQDLRTLGVERLDVVNLRRLDRGPGIIAEGEDVVPIEDQLEVLVAMRDEGLVGAIGLSNVDADQVRAAASAQIACVQNGYHLLDRSSEPVLEACRALGTTWVPFFPLGSAFDRGPSPVDRAEVQQVAAETGASAATVALSWLLAHDASTALIPGTRTVSHLEENVRAHASLLTPEQVALLDELPASAPA